MGDSDPATIFGHVATELGRRGLAFLFVREIEADGSRLALIKQNFGGPVVPDEKMSVADAKRVIARASPMRSRSDTTTSPPPISPAELVEGQYSRGALFG
ncbi:MULTISPECIES: hypothetical protein [Streptomyces]|uniref:hypothetical protein n=1 Tax=Streptomyces TaxID=1883 RepID=UPI0033C4B824